MQGKTANVRDLVEWINAQLIWNCKGWPTN